MRIGLCYSGTLLREVVVSGEDPFKSNSILCRNPESEDYVYCKEKDLKEISEVCRLHILTDTVIFVKYFLIVHGSGVTNLLF